MSFQVTYADRFAIGFESERPTQEAAAFGLYLEGAAGAMSAR